MAAHASGYNDIMANDRLNGVEVPFANISDSLIAKLRLENALSDSTINMFLKAVHHPHFQPQSLTIRKSSDIDQRVADYRNSIGQERSNGGEVRGVPYPILEGILDALAEDPCLVDEPILYQVPLVGVAELRRDHCLRSMALVHRTWTLASQRRLSRRITVRSPSEVLKLLRNPIVGPNTREFLIAYGSKWNRGFEYIHDPQPYYNPDEFETDLANLLARMPNLRSLTVLEGGFQGSKLLSIITQKKFLEKFAWHRAYGLSYGDLTRLGETLNYLPQLKQLEISGWSSNEAQDPWMIKPPQFQLNELKICLTPGDLYVTYSGWLLQSLSLTNPTKLTVDITAIRTLDMEDIFRRFPNSLDTLRALDTLHLVNKGSFIRYNLQQARTLLQACTQLRSLHLQCETAPVTEFIDLLPSSLEELRLSWFDMWMSPWAIIEKHLPQLLHGSALPRLKRIVLHNYEIAFDRDPSKDKDGRPIPHPTPETQEICDIRSIELDLYSKPPDWRAIL